MSIAEEPHGGAQWSAVRLFLQKALPRNLAEYGGVEAQYQLADAINNLGGNSIIIWSGESDNPIPNKYKHYNIKLWLFCR